MEKGYTENIKKIVVTGAESTGKSTLTVELAKHFNTCYVPEYAREYVESLNRPYHFDDIEIIARKQVELVNENIVYANNYLFIDTYLVIIKVWFEIVYKRCPGWIIEKLNKNDVDLYLLCETDLPWIPGPARENGGQMREFLMGEYKKEIEKTGAKYMPVRGLGEERTRNAVAAINKFYNLG